MALPARIDRKSHRQDAGKRSPGHRAWVRGHACTACGSTTAIECAHVRIGTGGGMGVKPSDRWCISLCKDCHSRQHTIGEVSFEREVWKTTGILMTMAEQFAKQSPHWPKLKDMP